MQVKSPNDIMPLDLLPLRNAFVPMGGEWIAYAMGGATWQPHSLPVKASMGWMCVLTDALW